MKETQCTDLGEERKKEREREREDRLQIKEQQLDEFLAATESRREMGCIQGARVKCHLKISRVP